MTKLITSRKSYTCHNCKGKINKGDKYKKTSKSIGSPNKWSASGDGAGFIQHGFRYTVAICQNCS